MKSMKSRKTSPTLKKIQQTNEVQLRQATINEKLAVTLSAFNQLNFLLELLKVCKTCSLPYSGAVGCLQK